MRCSRSFHVKFRGDLRDCLADLVVLQLPGSEKVLLRRLREMLTPLRSAAHGRTGDTRPGSYSLLHSHTCCDVGSSPSTAIGHFVHFATLSLHQHPQTREPTKRTYRGVLRPRSHTTISHTLTGSVHTLRPTGREKGLDILTSCKLVIVAKRLGYGVRSSFGVRGAFI